MSTEAIAATTARVKKTERLLTLREIQEAAGVSRATLYRWRFERGLKMFRVGGAVRIRESDWLAWLDKNSVSDAEVTP